MEIGIVGLPISGKTTIFNAVTRGHASVSRYSDKPNVGIAKVPDPRLDRLAKIYSPERVVQADVTYIDIPPPQEGFGKTRGISGEYLNALENTDAILIVARAFDDPAVTHIDETVDAIRDVENMLIELTFSDLSLLERRLERVRDALKGAKSIQRDILAKEHTLLERLQEQLEKGVAIRDQTLSDDDAQRVSGFQFLTAKPLIVTVNIAEAQMDEIEAMQRHIDSKVNGPLIRTTVIAGKLEMELAQMDEADQREFRDSLGAGEPGLDRMIKLSYDAVGLISFITIGKDEVRAWQITRGTVARKAAGKIHTDLERGFIRAQVVHYDQLIECGSIAEARTRGVLQQEGKDYVVNDGDIMDVLFNV